MPSLANQEEMGLLDEEMAWISRPKMGCVGRNEAGKGGFCKLVASTVCEVYIRSTEGVGAHAVKLTSLFSVITPNIN